MTDGHHRLHILHADNTGKTEDAKFIISCQVISSMHKKQVDTLISKNQVLKILYVKHRVYNETT